MPTLKHYAVGLAACLALTAASLSAVAGERLDRIMASKVLRVGTPGDYRPFAMKSDQGGFEGHDIDVIEMLAQDLGVRIEYVSTSWPNLMADIQGGKFDVAIGGITRNAARIGKVAMLPGYAPFGKVALVRTAEQAKYRSLEDLNQEKVRVIKNPGGTNETFVLAALSRAQISTHDQNAEIPGLIARGEGDVMITETYEALHYSRVDPRLTAKFVDAPLTPTSYLGFMLPVDDADFVRVMDYLWDLTERRGGLARAAERWLK